MSPSGELALAAFIDDPLEADVFTSHLRFMGVKVQVLTDETGKNQ